MIDYYKIHIGINKKLSVIIKLLKPNLTKI